MTDKIMFFFYERWKYFFGNYVAWYLICLINTGVPKMSYYIPIKLLAFYGGWGMGNIMYEVRRGIRNRKMPDRLMLALKYGISGIVIVTPIWIVIEIISSLLGIDSAPFVNNLN